MQYFSHTIFTALQSIRRPATSCFSRKGTVLFSSCPQGACKAILCVCTEEDEAPSTLPPAQIAAEASSGQAPSGQQALDSSAAEEPEREGGLQESAEMKVALQLGDKRQDRQRKNRCIHQSILTTRVIDQCLCQCVLFVCNGSSAC